MLAFTKSAGPPPDFFRQFAQITHSAILQGEFRIRDFQDDWRLRWEQYCGLSQHPKSWRPDYQQYSQVSRWKVTKGKTFPLQGMTKADLEDPIENQMMEDLHKISNHELCHKRSQPIESQEIFQEWKWARVGVEHPEPNSLQSKDPESYTQQIWFPAGRSFLLPGKKT